VRREAMGYLPIVPGQTLAFWPPGRKKPYPLNPAGEGTLKQILLGRRIIS
jgi:hypothetical protein